MAEDLNNWLARALAREEVEELRSVAIQVADQRKLDMANLLQAWKGHVEKIEGDLSLPESDRSLWGVHDFIAALYLRDFLQAGLADLTHHTRDRVEGVLAGIDERFISYTELDVVGLAERVDGHSDPTRGWWWRRVPNRGLVCEELNRYGG